MTDAVPTTRRLCERYRACGITRAKLPPPANGRERDRRAADAEREKDTFHAYNIVLVLMDAQAGVLETQGHRAEAKAMRAMASRVEVRGIYALLGNASQASKRPRAVR